MPPKLTIVDVGTHAGQEYLALFGHSAAGYLRRWLRLRRRARRAGEPAPTFAALAAFRADVAALRAARARVFYVMVEPNARLFALPVYRAADLALNAALCTEPGRVALTPLWLDARGPTGQGSSLFAAKPNLQPGAADLVLALDAGHFAAMLAARVPEGPVVLRLNNEGAEADTILAFHRVLGPRLAAVMGSLNDVEKVHGPAARTALDAHLEGAGIAFLPFHSDPATWAAAAARLRGLLP
jgi:hypothetical protein